MLDGALVRPRLLQFRWPFRWSWWQFGSCATTNPLGVPNIEPLTHEPKLAAEFNRGENHSPPSAPRPSLCDGDIERATAIRANGFAKFGEGDGFGVVVVGEIHGGMVRPG